MALRDYFERLWYSSQSRPNAILRVLSRLYLKLSTARAKKQIADAYRSQLPTIVVGNLTVGGTGKSPVTLAIVKALQAEGFRPAILSRGYGAKSVETGKTHWVEATDLAMDVGDEPLMMHLASGVPVLVNPDRGQAAKDAEVSGQFDVLVLDDGLQHYKLHSDITLCVVDAIRGFGNGWVLPAGPLRESLVRLRALDFVLLNGHSEPLARYIKEYTSAILSSFQLEASSIRQATNGRVMTIQHFRGKEVQALVGIGNPDRFLASLHQLGVRIADTHRYPDHHDYAEKDLESLASDTPILTTSKDWVKLKEFRLNAYVLEVEAVISQEIIAAIIHRLRNHQKINRSAAVSN